MISSLATFSPSYLIKCSRWHTYVSCFVCILIFTSRCDIGWPVVCDCGIVVVVVVVVSFLFVFFVCFSCCFIII